MLLSAVPKKAPAYDNLLSKELAGQQLEPVALIASGNPLLVKGWDWLGQGTNLATVNMCSA